MADVSARPAALAVRQIRREDTKRRTSDSGRDGNGQSLDWGGVVCLRRRLRLLGRAHRVVLAKIPRAP